MTPVSSPEWPDEKVAVLRHLWAEDHSTAEIGRRLRMSKNAVVGKAHRLDLRAASHRSGARAATTRRGRHAVGPSQSSRTSCRSPPPRRHRPLGPSRHARQPTARTPAAPSTNTQTHSCCWPLGEPGRPDFRFCDAPAGPGRPYCDAHTRVAYAKPRRTVEQIAGYATT